MIVRIAAVGPNRSWLGAIYVRWLACRRDENLIGALPFRRLQRRKLKLGVRSHGAISEVIDLVAFCV